jgi:hypothetical protein
MEEQGLLSLVDIRVMEYSYIVKYLPKMNLPFKKRKLPSYLKGFSITNQVTKLSITNSYLEAF